MPVVCFLGDAHLLRQAEWTEDENALREEATEVLDNFQKAIDQISKEAPEVVVLAGDMFDTQTQSRQRVIHREADKYMVTIRHTLSGLADCGCKIFVLRGNHDSVPVLKSLQDALKDKVTYPGTSRFEIDNMAIAFMDTHYLVGQYDIPFDQVPSDADVLVMHESVPFANTQGLSKQTLASICERFKVVLNGHMHFFREKTLGIPNFYLLPAFIPSREIKENWMVKYRFEDGQVTEQDRRSPFGYVLYDGNKPQFNEYIPTQTIIHVEIVGKDISDFLQGIDRTYSQLLERKDRSKVRAWIKTNADRITIDRVMWEYVEKYPDIHTIDIVPEKTTTLRVPSPVIEEAFQDVAFSRDELIDKVAQGLTGEQLDLARRIFDEVFTIEIVSSKNADEKSAFWRLLEIASQKFKVSNGFIQRAWDLTLEKKQK